MRTSATQSDVLLILYALEQKGYVKAVPSMTLLRMINETRYVADTNFRTSCHKLVEHELLYKYRLNSQKLAFKLTEQGQKVGIRIYTARQT